MKIAFLGTGRMGTELALQLMKQHELVVWNRTQEKTARLAEAGASVADTPEQAVAGADVVVSCLFGPPQVREVIVDAGLIPEGVTWIDATTVSPADATAFAEAVPGYVAAPVLGTLGPARNGKLGVYVGTADDARREQALDIVRPWADPDRLVGVDTPAKALAGKLLANLAIAIPAQGVREALSLGDACGLQPEETLKMLDSTGLAFIKTMKTPFVLGERDTDPGDFTVQAIAKDVRLMLATVGGRTEMPALNAALASLHAQEQKGRGDEDFSRILLDR